MNTLVVDGSKSDVVNFISTFGVNDQISVFVPVHGEINTQELSVRYPQLNFRMGESSEEESSHDDKSLFNYDFIHSLFLGWASFQ